MNSKIRVEFDFDNNVPYLQIRLEGHDQDGGELADKTLKNFIERANHAGGMTVQYFGAGSGLPQIRPGISPLIDNTDRLRQAEELLGYAVQIFDKQGMSDNTISAIKNFLGKPSIRY